MIDKKRILFLAPFPPPVHGSSMVSRQIVESQVVKEQFDIDSVNISTSRSMSEIGRWSVRKPFRFLYAYFKTLSLLLFRRYDLCYCALTCHGKPFLKDMPFVMLFHMFGKRVVLHQHNKGMSSDVDNRIYNFLFHKVYNDSKVILLSWRLYPDIERIVDRANVIICPNGIEYTAKGECARQNSGIPRILFLSNLIVDKGILVLLDTLQILKGNGYAFECDVIGKETRDIDAQRFAEEVHSRGLETAVHYYGSKYGDEKASYFENADIFVFPSFYSNECFPLVVLEAMQYGLPVVTTDVGGVPDIVKDGETGFIVEKRNPGKLAEAIAKLMDDAALRNRMGDAGHARFLEDYTEEKFIADICKIFNSLICN